MRQLGFFLILGITIVLPHLSTLAQGSGVAEPDLKKEITHINQLLAQTEFSSALAAADALVDKYPNSRQARSTRANVFIKMRKYDDACNDLDILKILGDASAQPRIDKYCIEGFQYDRLSQFTRGRVDTTLYILSDGMEVYTDVDTMAQIPGSQATMYKYISANLHYPPIDMEDGIEGTVNVQFVVDTAGNTSHYVVTKKVERLMDIETVRVIKSLPKFKPAVKNGQKVNVFYTIPVQYSLH